MNILKKNGGFTLVELIVVIAILAILAGIAVPAYSGYINSANEAADITVCDAIKTAAMAACATTGEVEKIVITSSSVKATVNGSEIDLMPTSVTAGTPAADFAVYYTSALPTFKTQVTGTSGKTTATTATWDNTSSNTADTKGEWVFS